MQYKTAPKEGDFFSDEGLCTGKEKAHYNLENPSKQERSLVKYDNREPEPMEPLMVDGDPPPEYLFRPPTPIQGSDPGDTTEGSPVP